MLKPPQKVMNALGPHSNLKTIFLDWSKFGTEPCKNSMAVNNMQPDVDRFFFLSFMERKTLKNF